ncbi:hypothetical protein QQP08_001301 [Theobroma cacao]|nr:hypothetical protein QQP08_001301 [Theobroma cacao]
MALDCALRRRIKKNSRWDPHQRWAEHTPKFRELSFSSKILRMLSKASLAALLCAISFLRLHEPLPTSRSSTKTSKAVLSFHKSTNFTFKFLFWHTSYSCVTGCISRFSRLITGSSKSLNTYPKQFFSWYGVLMKIVRPITHCYARRSCGEMYGYRPNSINGGIAVNENGPNRGFNKIG